VVGLPAQPFQKTCPTVNQYTKQCGTSTASQPKLCAMVFSSRPFVVPPLSHPSVMPSLAPSLFCQPLPMSKQPPRNSYRQRHRLCYDLRVKGICRRTSCPYKHRVPPVFPKPATSSDELVSMTAVTTAMERVARTECEKMKTNVENLTMDLCCLKKRLDQMDSQPTATSQVLIKVDTCSQTPPVVFDDELVSLPIATCTWPWCMWCGSQLSSVLNKRQWFGLCKICHHFNRMPTGMKAVAMTEKKEMAVQTRPKTWSKHVQTTAHFSLPQECPHSSHPSVQTLSSMTSLTSTATDWSFFPHDLLNVPGMFPALPPNWHVCQTCLKSTPLPMCCGQDFPDCRSPSPMISVSSESRESTGSIISDTEVAENCALLKELGIHYGECYKK